MKEDLGEIGKEVKKKQTFEKFLEYKENSVINNK